MWEMLHELKMCENCAWNECEYCPLDTYFKVSSRSLTRCAIKNNTFHNKSQLFKCEGDRHMQLPYKLVYRPPKMSKDTNLRELIIRTKLVQLRCNKNIGVFAVYRVRHWYCTFLLCQTVCVKTVSHCSMFLLEFFSIPTVIVMCA